MNYYLLDNPNPNGNNYYPSRNDAIRLIVLHTAERLPDYNPPDHGAEQLAKYASSTPRAVSWHASVDTDSIIYMLPDNYTGWHVRNYNSESLGIEMSTQAHRWWERPSWDAQMIDNAAVVGAEWAKKYNIPIVKITKAQADMGLKGFIGHTDLDPTRRKDPGKGFSWATYLSRVRYYSELMEYFWKWLVKAGLIAGDPEYYYDGSATTSEKDHAINVAAAAFKAHNNKTATTDEVVADLIRRLQS